MSGTRLDKVFGAVRSVWAKLNVADLAPKKGSKGRVISTTQVKMNHKLETYKAKQAMFQCEDGNPIWLKCGTRDKLVYLSTWLGCVVGMADGVYFIFNQAKPASWRAK